MGKPTDTQKRADVRRPTNKLFRAVKKARKAIYKGYKVSGTRVDRLLGGASRAPNTVCAAATPTTWNANCRLKNAFMNCLPGLDIYQLLTVDLLHEVELGVWKALFTHIIRILSTHSPEAVSELDRRCPPLPSIRRISNGHPLYFHALRFRLIAPFGKDTIRRFANNASQMKKLAAHHFEDLLQV